MADALLCPDPNHPIHPLLGHFKHMHLQPQLRGWVGVLVTEKEKVESNECGRDYHYEHFQSQISKTLFVYNLQTLHVILHHFLLKYKHACTI
jgi:hypothetical protein